MDQDLSVSSCDLDMKVQGEKALNRTHTRKPWNIGRLLLFHQKGGSAGPQNPEDTWSSTGVSVRSCSVCPSNQTKASSCWSSSVPQRPGGQDFPGAGLPLRPKAPPSTGLLVLPGGCNSPGTEPSALGPWFSGTGSQSGSRRQPQPVALCIHLREVEWWLRTSGWGKNLLWKHGSLTF